MEEYFDGTSASAYPDQQSDSDKGQYADVLAEAHERYKRWITSESENRETYSQSTRFVWGEQWPLQLRTERDRDGKPVLTSNQLAQYRNQVVNDIRQNKPAMAAHPASEDATEDTAGIIQGLLRSIERKSVAQAAYLKGVENAVDGGFGYWRITSDYIRPDSFDQEIQIHPIDNALAVVYDPETIEPDYSDCRGAFVVEDMPKDEFKRQYPKAGMVDWENGDAYLDYNSEEEIRVVDYYRKVHQKKTLVKLATGEIAFKEDLDPEKLAVRAGLPLGVGTLKVDDFIAKGPDGKPVSRETEVAKIEFYKLTGREVLEKYDVPGEYIPVVKLCGVERFVDGKRKTKGLITDAMDPQRMVNYWLPLSLDTKVPTLRGWSTIGELAIGDMVFSDDGQLVRVLGKSPIYLHRECYAVKFSDGSKIVADAQHPWMVEEKVKRTSKGVKRESKKVTTAELNPAKHSIKLAQSLTLPSIKLPVDPYYFGFWLGNGTSTGGQLTVNPLDAAEVTHLLRERGLKTGDPRSYSGKAPTIPVYGMCGLLRDLGVLNNKHIPNQYLRAAKEQRLELLRGLMDSDGSINKTTSQCQFSQTNLALTNQFMELLASLGISRNVVKRVGRTSKLVNGQVIVSQDNYAVSFTAPENTKVFNVCRKYQIQTRSRVRHVTRTNLHRIVSVDPVSSVPVQCIAVDCPSHLFLVGSSMVPTHNTSATERIALDTKAPYIAPVGADTGLEWEYENANRANLPILHYNPYDDQQRPLPPPQKQPFAGVPTGIVEMLNICKEDLKATTGMYAAAVGKREGDISGRAILALDRQSDTSTYHFVDNMNRAIAYTGRIIVSQVPYVYDTQRTVRIVGEEDEEENVIINQPQQSLHPTTGQVITKLLNDLSQGEYIVTVEAGPAYGTRRIEAANSISQFIQTMPAAAPVLGPLFAKMQDWPEAEKVSKLLTAIAPPPVQAIMAGEEEIPPAVQGQMQQMQQQMQQMQQALQQAGQQAQELQFQNQKLQLDAKNQQLTFLSKIHDTNAGAQVETIKARNEALQGQNDAAKVALDFVAKIAPLLIANPQATMADVGMAVPAVESLLGRPLNGAT